MSAIDEILNYSDDEWHEMQRTQAGRDKYESALSELSRLRLAASEADALRAERDELKAKANVSICAWCGKECEKESGAIASHVIVCEKRPEHAMFAKFEELLATVAEQARQIEAARNVVAPFASIGAALTKQSDDDESPWAQIQDDEPIMVGWRHVSVTAKQLRDIAVWLAANAPEPAPEAAEATK